MKWVWVVEMWMGNRWEPCVSCRLKRHDAAMALRVWQGTLPDDRFRVAKYIRSSNARLDRPEGARRTP